MITENSNEENQVLGTHDKNVDVTCYILHVSNSEKRDTKRNSNSLEKSIIVLRKYYSARLQDLFV